jgi:hypothetical protein
MTYQVGDVVRAKKGGHPYLVCYVNETCCLVTDMTRNDDPALLFALLPRDYSKYARDMDMNCYTVHVQGYWMDQRNIFTLATKIRLH